MESGYLKPLYPQPFPDPLLARHNPTKYCTYHQQRGRGTDHCYRLRHEVQNLIDNKMIAPPQEPNITTKPLPIHDQPGRKVDEEEEEDPQQHESYGLVKMGHLRAMSKKGNCRHPIFDCPQGSSALPGTLDDESVLCVEILTRAKGHELAAGHLPAKDEAVPATGVLHHHSAIELKPEENEGSSKDCDNNVDYQPLRENELNFCYDFRTAQTEPRIARAGLAAARARMHSHKFRLTTARVENRASKLNILKQKHVPTTIRHTFPHVQVEVFNPKAVEKGNRLSGSLIAQAVKRGSHYLSLQV
ncbi:hypothetical protein HYC85_030783 [Camellia sinensis]|uniref:Uncharacterized protein n=1 Tax=Camellia sinensis TaxID=4442 RepID=A0A7J7G1S1_CAMSI|nr:hypothetical protein HYC85_030783 [Camellia sinensis]